MKKFIHFYAFAILLVISFTKTKAQYSVEIYIEQAEISNYAGDKYGPRIRLYKDEWKDVIGNALWLDSYNRAICALLPNISNGMVSVNKTYRTTLAADDPLFDLIVVTHEERKQGSDDCTFQGIADVSTRKPDLYEARADLTINLNDYPPGEYSPTFIMQTVSGNAVVDVYLKIRYVPVPLKAPTGPGGQHCADENFVIATENSYSSATNTTGLVYQWEYHIKGDKIRNPAIEVCRSSCYDNYYICAQREDIAICDTEFYACQDNCDLIYPAEIDNWVSFQTTSAPLLSFNPLTKIFNGSLLENTSVEVRVRAKGAELFGNGFSPPSFFNFIPPAPSLGNITIEAACPNAKDGIIHVTGVTGTGDYHYILRPGHNNIGECNPEIEKSCFSSNASGSISGVNFDINTNVSTGPATFWITNNGGDVGVCATKMNIDVGAVSILSLTTIEDADKLNLSCYNSKNGEIKLKNTGGKANYTYSLHIQNVYDSSNTTGIFDRLKAGIYEATVTDGCGQSNAKTSASVTLTEPKKIIAVSDSVPVTCNSPANGSIEVTISDGPGTYNYSLTGGNKGTLNLLNSTDKKWIQSSLSAGSYSIEVNDSQRPACSGYTKTLVLQSPTVLTLLPGNITADSVTCNSGDDGKITLTGVDLTGVYTYVLTRNGNTALNTTTNPVFDKLVGGSYILAQKRSNAQCNDIFTYPLAIDIYQPSQITSVLTKQDITCYGEKDGKIDAVIAGGTGSTYSRNWQFKNNTGGWSDLSTTVALSNLFEGAYRLRVTDKKQCNSISNEVVIIEPPVLNLDKVSVNDIKCFLEKGTIEITSTGGTEPYIYEYLSSNETTFKPFTRTTPLDAGLYTVQVKDSRGCGAKDLGQYSITNPPSAITFSTVLSDFNGFNISCFGGSNGSVTLTTQGGNGPGYTGYQYAVDARGFQAETKLDSINAGTHIIKVKDGRSCVVSKNIVFTQTTEKLISTLIEKKNVTCLGDKTGIFEVNGSGGLLPFQYSINGSANQQSGRFTSLAVGDYTITLTDKNKCSANFIEKITSINPPIVIQLIPTDVSCFDGHDGIISSAVTDGVPPFLYKWQGLTATTSNVTGLKKGTYSLSVTDNAGCKMEAKIEVDQPAKALAAILNIVPVCYGRTDGKITILSAGGTAPYLYSKDGGLTYQENPLFLIGVGDYTMNAKDANACISTALAKVIQRNDKPEPNFLAATKRNALDTLILTEISVPKPDSIAWVFDAKASVVNDNQWSPQINFKEAGTYSVSMTGFFGGCDYTVTKNLYVSPFDPNATEEKKPGYKPIESITVTPNPSTGEFEVAVKLNKKRNLSIILYDMLGVSHYSKNWEAIEEVTQKVLVPDVSSGIYLLRVITETDAKEVRIVINK